MTTTNFRKVLIDIANEESSNHLSKVIAYYYPNLNISSRENLFESLMTFLERSESQEFNFEELLEKIKDENIDLAKYVDKDYRIKEIKISNLRGIPSLEETEEVPFGINLIDENEIINNAIILANNGTGKSSVFSGLEMIYTQEIGEKKLRSINPEANSVDDYNIYLQRINESKKPYCAIKTMEGDFDLNNKIFNNKDLLKIFNPSSHFITEYDVISNGWLDYNKDDKYDYSFHNIVAKSLGLDEFLSLQNISQQIPSYRRSKETTARNIIQKEIDDNNISIKNKTTEIQSKTIELEELKKGGNIENQDNQKSKLDILNNLKNKTLNVNFDQTNYLNEIGEFKNSFQKYNSLYRNKRSSVEKNFLEAGKELIHEFDNCPFCLDSNKTIEEIKIEVEKRLSELEQFTSLNDELKNKFRIVSNLLWTLLNNLSSSTDFFNTDRIELSPFVNLEEIRSEENRLYFAISPLINDGELNDFIYSFTQKLIPTDQDYNELFDLLNKNKEIFEKQYITLTKEVNFLFSKRKESIESELKIFLEDNSNLPAEQKVIVLDNNIKELIEQINLIEIKNKQLEINFIIADKKAKYLVQIKKEIEVFNSKLKLKVDELVNNGFKPIKNTVEDILNQYFHDDPQLKLEINLRDNKFSIEGVQYITKYIVAEIVDINSNNSVTSPQIYFNTFRFKLFCLMISLSIALASRKTYKVNMPLVMDDLFYASDFINKNSFAEFLQKIILLFYKYTPEMPLQLIIFTHDDVIFKSSIDGLYEFNLENNSIDIDHDRLCDSNKQDLVNKSIIARMFNITDRDEKPSNFNNGDQFWSLLYELPKQILIN